MKVITAMGNEYLNNKLKEENNIEIICNDIIYKEGILEIIEIYENIDILIFSELLPGEIKIDELITKIKEKNNKIKIIIIIEEKNEKKENNLYNKGIYKIIYNNKINFNELINIINYTEENNKDLKEEIEKLKKIIFENQKNEKIENNKIIKSKINNNKINNIIKIIINKIIFKMNQINYNDQLKQKSNKKIISILGPRGVGKSIFSINLAKININNKNKILILDFDFLNNSIHTILGFNKYSTENNYKINKNKIYYENLNNIKNINYLYNKINNNKIKSNILNNIIKLNKKIDIFSGDNLLDNKSSNLNNILIDENKINKKINNLINELNKIYDLIIIDTSSENNINILKNIINLSNKTIFISDTNLLEINKAIKLLHKYILENKINKNKFNILFNKYNENSIDINLLKRIFSEFKIIGYLKYNKKYNKLINKNYKCKFYDKKIKKEYLKINYKINNF